MTKKGSPPKKNAFGQFFNRLLRKSSKPEKTQSCPQTEKQRTGSDLAKEYFIINKKEIPISVSRTEMNVGDMVRNWLEEPNPFQRISNTNYSNSLIPGKNSSEKNINTGGENQQKKPGDVFEQKKFSGTASEIEQPECPEKGFQRQISNPSELNKWIVSMKELRDLRPLDRGSYGQVYIGKWCQTDVAIKKMFPPNSCNGYYDLNPQELKDFEEEFIREIYIMMSLRHENIVQFYGAVLEPEKCIVTEYVIYGSIYNLLHRRSKNQQIQQKIKNSLPKRLIMALQVACGVNYLHYKKILHLDLKTQNLLVGEGFKVKVCDFGLSRIKVLRTYQSKGTFGTPEYMAPEVLRHGVKSEKADIYSFGVVLYELVTKIRPWEKIASEIVFARVALYNKKLEIPENVDERIKQLILKCWQDNPAERPTFDKIIGELEEIINDYLKKPQVTQQQNPTGESSQP